MDIYTIYRATNLINNKVYIGFTENLTRRIEEHKYGYKYSTNKVFYKAIKKYGWDNFLWEAIYQSADYEHTLKIMEPYFIAEHKSCINVINCNGYNISTGGEGTKGYTHTQEARQKMSLLRKGRAPWNKGKIGEYSTTAKGKIISEETKKKLREANLGKKQSAETIAKRSAKLTGVKRTEEFIKKMTGRKHSAESIEKMKVAQTGKIISEETKAKIREARKHQVFTNETKKKLSGKIVVIDKQGNLLRIDSDLYYSQLGPKSDWEWVSHKSTEAKMRRG